MRGMYIMTEKATQSQVMEPTPLWRHRDRIEYMAGVLGSIMPVNSTKNSEDKPRRGRGGERQRNMPQLKTKSGKSQWTRCWPIFLLPQNRMYTFQFSVIVASSCLPFFQFFFQLFFCFFFLLLPSSFQFASVKRSVELKASSKLRAPSYECRPCP